MWNEILICVKALFHGSNWLAYTSSQTWSNNMDHPKHYHIVYVTKYQTIISHCCCCCRHHREYHRRSSMSKMRQSRSQRRLADQLLVSMSTMYKKFMYNYIWRCYTTYETKLFRQVILGCTTSLIPTCKTIDEQNKKIPWPNIRGSYRHKNI